MYVEELQSYKVLQYYVMDAAISLLFWRGQVPFMGIYLPVHSLVAFLAGITLCERPTLYPSYFFFGIAWFLLAVQIDRNCSANPWTKSKTFIGLLSALATGKSISGPLGTIEAHQNEKESKEEAELLKSRLEKAKKEAEETQEAQMKLLQEHEAMMANVGDQTADTDISTNQGGISLDPMKFILYPIQQYLFMACNALRFSRNVISWDEPVSYLIRFFYLDSQTQASYNFCNYCPSPCRQYIAFFLTAGSIVLGVVFLFVPWAFLCRWTSRIIAWLVFGPHMKLVDMFWYSKLEELTAEQRRQQIRDALTAQLDAAKAVAAAARVQREDAVKLKDIKQALYGKFITKVPILRFERFPDIPLHASTAKPYDASETRGRAIPDRVAGQQLVGTMIPRIVDEDELPSEGTDANAKKNV
jgi:hypothetical protein